MKKILIGLSLAVSLFASIESEVDAERFSWKDGVLTDSFAQMQWQDNSDAKSIKKDWQGAMHYCANLTLGGKSDWRLPNLIELKYANQYKFKNVVKKDYYSSTPDPSYTNQAFGMEYGWNFERVFLKSMNVNVRCARGSVYDSRNSLLKNITFNKNLQITTLYKSLNLDKKIKTISSIEGYENFIKQYPNIKEAREAQYNIYKLSYIPIKKQNNISGYESFINTYPKAPQVKEAIKNIHKLAYDKAKQINTISAYNTFVYAYPFASQVRDANDKAYDIESKKYTDIGIIGGFFQKEAKMEKKARKLLIKAKQIERIAQDYSGNAKAGYIIVANRMYQLLQDKFDDSEATLRYLESQDFKDFTTSFKQAMKDIKYILNQISNNTSDISQYAQESISISKQGFADSKADREMSRYKDEQHHQWEKRMRVRDKGNM